MKNKLILGIALLVICIAVLVAVYRSVENTQAANTSPGFKNIDNSSKKAVNKVVTNERDADYVYGESVYLSNYDRFADKSIVPHNLHDIYGFNGLSTKERLKSIARLSSELSHEELEALFSYLNHGENTKSGFVIKNDILNILIRQKVFPEDLTDVMIDIFFDRRQPHVLRDYVIQHLRRVYNRVDSSKKEVIRETFYQALQETESSIPGTTLLALEYLSKKHDEFNAQTVSDAATVFVRNKNANSLTRITAVKICEQMGVAEIASDLREIILNTDSITLRIATISSLGALGSKEDIALIEDIVSNGDRRYQPAAQLALKRLKRKISKLTNGKI